MIKCFRLIVGIVLFVGLVAPYSMAEEEEKPLRKRGSVVSIDLESKVIKIKASILRMTSKDIDESKIPTYEYIFGPNTKCIDFGTRNRNAKIESLKVGATVMIEYEEKEEKLIANKIIWGIPNRR